MAYYILIQDDDSLFGSHKERLIQRQKLVNDLIFITDPIYRNVHDMTNATVLLEYILPVSRRYKTELLTLSDKRYKDCYLQYKLPVDTEISSEAGEIELQLTFAWTEKNSEDEIIQRVRKTSSTTIRISPIADWASIIPDDALTVLDQRLLVMNAQLNAIDEYMNVLDNNKVDNLVYNEQEDVLHLSAKGKLVGDKVSIKDMIDDGVPVIDLNSNSDTPATPTEEDNVVEF